MHFAFAGDVQGILDTRPFMVQHATHDTSSHEFIVAYGIAENMCMHVTGTHRWLQDACGRTHPDNVETLSSAKWMLHRLLC